jgi:hypothetical protein
MVCAVTVSMTVGFSLFSSGFKQGNFRGLKRATLVGASPSTGSSSLFPALGTGPVDERESGSVSNRDQQGIRAIGAPSTELSLARLRPRRA